MYLYERDIELAVVYPISIKRFIQMKLQKNKTDKSDARMIVLYGQEQPGLLPWIPAPDYITKCKQLQSLTSQGVKSGVLICSLKRQLKQVRLEIDFLAYFTL
nr:transposase [uncultured Draconibacterium sp.]